MQNNETIGVLQNKMLAYPNPAKEGKFSVVAPAGGGNVSLEVYNAVGIKVLQKQKVNNNQKMNFSNQAKGIYFIKLTANNKVITQKLIAE